MSWSVSASGKIEAVKDEMVRQFAHPLAEPPAGLADEGERETVGKIMDVIFQCLSTFDPEKTVAVSANGYISFDDYETKAGPRQTVSLSITPGP